MLVCARCGTVIEDSELQYDYEDYGEEVALPCRCGGDFVEATQCSICGEWFDNDGLHGVCECCFEEYETVGEALAMGEENTEDVDINGFIATVLTKEQINNILTKWVEENFTDHSSAVIKYCENDKSYYSDWLAEKYGD